jgi:hypothetical protein
VVGIFFAHGAHSLWIPSFDSYTQKTYTMKKLLLTLLVLVIGISSIKLFAQGKNNQVGIGLQLGDPSGLSLKFYNPGRASVDILAAWDLNNYLFVNVHALYH